ncbi:hypothetical protein EVAR_86185_1 [Eumeta japonica]|uniref:Mos1 transposase HTH domain-containing protein n=1 Tax=Eumeta variegata TaxID=151549 RepID=A0A4C1UCF8_EUMVA|nr:hypothetical protein EVAR_86185_1 [Eumeta japonica]
MYINTVSVRVAQNWFKRLQSDNFDVKDEPRSAQNFFRSSSGLDKSGAYAPKITIRVSPVLTRSESSLGLTSSLRFTHPGRIKSTLCDRRALETVDLNCYVAEGGARRDAPAAAAPASRRATAERERRDRVFPASSCYKTLLGN